MVEKPIMRVLSLFDGISCGRVALERAGIFVTKYYASEIDKHAIITSRKNYPDIIQLGDVRNVRDMAENGLLGHIDLVIGGSPCQGFSFAGEQLAFNDPRSALFWEFVFILRALQRINPAIKFLLENVRMKKEHLDVITNFMGFKPVKINSALVSAQNRERYYWCNWHVSQPEDRGIYLRDIIEVNGTGYIKQEGTLKLRNDKSMCLDANYHKGADNHGQRTLIGCSVTLNGILPYKNDERKGSFSEIGTIATPDNKVAALTVSNVSKITNTPLRIGTASDIKGHDYNKRIYSIDGKSPSLAAASGGNLEPKISISERRLKNMKTLDDKSFTFLSSMHKGEQANGQTLVVTNLENITYRKLTPIECERLQTLPDNYTAGVSDTQRYKQLGNGWTVEVIAHIFRGMPR